MLPNAMTKQTRTGPRVGPDDLTAKAKIRNAALELFGAEGEDGTSMRAIATAAGVTVGLLVHHFGTKDGIRDAVEDLVVDHFVEAIAHAEQQGSPRDVAAARNHAVAEMLDSHPEVVNYMRRALLEPSGTRGDLLVKLTELTRREVTTMRRAGVASTSREESSQIIETMIQQVGRLFLQPMVDAMWEHLTPPDSSESDKPDLVVAVRKASSPN
ncbi:TetR family transcriptional regulator (plasmid) [Rhodococcus ruber]|nr:TetR family transcriptional regulator [Rhodococcus ruber]